MINPSVIKQARRLLVEMHHNSGVGHLGGNLSIIDCLTLLNLEIKTSRDVVVLSKGHSAGALYVTMALEGLIPKSELNTFHKNHTRLPGHPPVNIFPNIPFATGSLGHGLSLAGGLALGHKLQNMSIDTYCIMSDGEWQEGSNWEALWFCCHHQLRNLTIIIDSNGLQGFGRTDEISSMQNLSDRIAAHGAQCVNANGHNLSQLRKAFKTSKTSTPRVLNLNTTKGRGLSDLEGLLASHYEPPNQDQLKNF